VKSTLGGLLNRAPVRYVGRSGSLFGTLMQRGSSDAQMAAMGSVGTLFSIVDLLASSTAQVGWKLWRKAASGLDADRVEVTRHLALQVWNKPNPFYTRQLFVETLQQHFELVGEMWIVVVADKRMPGVPTELWPVRPDRMAPVPDPVDYLKGYVYTSPDGEKIPLRLDQVIFQRRPNPLDPYRGMGPVQALLADLDASRYSSEWNRNFFLNSAEPGGVIEVDRRLGDPEWEDMTRRWNIQHKGVANAHRVAVIEAGKWVQRAFSQRDMQFTELRTVTRDTIMEAYRISKTMLGVMEEGNRAQSKVHRAVFAEELIVPRLERWKGMHANDFLPKFGRTVEGLEFDFESPVPPDAEAENAERDSLYAAAKLAIDAGFTGDSVQVALSLPESLKWKKPEPPQPMAAPGKKPTGDPLPA
jgi:HK97 family phage portal protein